MAQVVRFWAKSRNLRTRPIASHIGKWHRSLISKNTTQQSLVQQQYEVHADVRVAIGALDYECMHDARTQSLRLSAARLQLAVGRRGLGPRDQEEQRTQRASFVPTYHTRVA